MADQPITGLPTKTASGVAATDKMLGIDSAEGYQILVRDVAKYIIENCDVSTLAGAVRTPKAAIDLLNSNMSNLTMSSAKTVPDLDTLTTTGFYYVNGATTNRPADASYWYIAVFSASGSFTKQFAMMVNTTEKKIYHRVYNGTAWSSWDLLPTRAEVDTLNSNTLQGSRGANKNPDVYTTIGYYYSTNYEITLTGLPVKTGYLYVLPLPGAPGYLKQIFMPYNSNKMAIRTQYDDGGGAEWSDWELLPERAEITALNSNLSSLYCREYSYANGTSYKAAVTDVISKLGNTTARYWVIIQIGSSRLSLMIIKDGTPWSNGILTGYGSGAMDVYFVMSRSGQSGETVVYLRKLLTGDLEE